MKIKILKNHSENSVTRNTPATRLRQSFSFGNLNHLTSSLFQSLSFKKNVLTNSSTAISMRLTPASRILRPREIQPTTPKLIVDSLPAQQFMTKALSLEHLKQRANSAEYDWIHPEFKYQLPILLNVNQLEQVSDTSIVDNFSQIEMRDTTTGEVFYIQYIPKPEYAFAIKGMEELYNLLFECKIPWFKPVIKHYLCFEKDNLNAGIIGIGKKIYSGLQTAEQIFHFSSSDRYKKETREVLAALEPLHEILSSNVLETDIMIYCHHRHPIPQITNIENTFTFNKNENDIDFSFHPELDQWFDEEQVAFLKDFVMRQNSNSNFTQKLSNIFDQYFCGSLENKENSIKTLQARINSAYIQSS